MQMGLRWYGAQFDTVTLTQIRQIPGVSGVITTLYDTAPGDVWPRERIDAMKAEVEAAGLRVLGIESVNVHDDIKAAGKNRDLYIEHYIQTLENLGRADIRMVCYNFMPVFDWTRSDLAKPRPDGSTVLAYDQYRNPALDGIVRYVELDELLRTADLISLHCPLTAETHHIINADTIKMMRDNAILVNTSRGGLIDTNALIDALRARKFAGVGLDVYEDEDGQVFEDFSDDVLQNEVVPILMSFPNVVVTSHQAFFTRTALQSIAITTMENARAFARGEKLVNEVKG